MQRRNFTLLVIVLVIIAAIVIGFLYFRKPTGNIIPDTGGTNFFSNFNPFGTTTPKPKETPTDISGYVPPENPVNTAKLKKVSSVPIAGYIIFKKERLIPVPEVTPPALGASTTTPVAPVTKKATKVVAKAPLTELVSALRYVDRATGNVFQTFADKIEEGKFSTTTIPSVYEAYFGNKGDAVSMRYLKNDFRTIETFLGVLPKEVIGADTVGGNTIKGILLPDNIVDISIAPDTSKLFYLFKNKNGIIGVTAGMLGDKKVQVFDSPFTEWLSLWPNANVITLTTKPSSGIPGYMYFLDPNKKSFTKTLGPINGLTTLTSPNGKLVLYGDDNVALHIYHTDTRQTDEISLRTMPEKCVWGNTSDLIYCSVPKSISGTGYPDVWYQGEVSFSDQIWKIDLTSGNTILIVDPVEIEGGEEIDGTKLSIDEKNDYLFFVNKKDSFLWEMNLR